MQLREALSDIAEIRAALDRTQTYRGFRSIAIGISALFVMSGAVVQLRIDVTRRPGTYLNTWLCVALASLVVAVIEMIVRGRVSNDLAVWKMHGRVAMSLLPSFLVGALITAVVILDPYRSMVKLNYDNMWLLPGIWSMIYSLGLFASCNLLHRTTRFAALYYLVAGLLYFSLTWRERALEAWHMVAIFGVGQLILAAILFWKVERRFG
ncbi:MAG: hypothetical protein AAGA30_19445 [Planctomycetota bacterium]